MNTLATRIKEERLKKKLSQEDLAKVLGMKRENVSNYERGVITNVPIDVLNKMAEFFNVSIDYLLGNTDNPYRKNTAEDDFKDVFFEDETEEEMLLMFRKQTETMDDETKRKFTSSLETLMQAAKHIVEDDSKWD